MVSQQSLEPRERRTQQEWRMRNTAVTPPAAYALGPPHGILSTVIPVTTGLVWPHSMGSPGVTANRRLPNLISLEVSTLALEPRLASRAVYSSRVGFGSSYVTVG